MAFFFILNNKVDIANVARLRMGSHDLNIEAQRWGAHRVPRASRLCTCCDLGVVEDEKHFVMECPLYAEPRATWYGALGYSAQGEGPRSMRHLVNGQTPHEWQALAIFLRTALKLRSRRLTLNQAVRKTG